ncbi:MAG: CPBP family intramembrane metalloprotease [Turicibacter sp.]|nr:CPBP family intramembrane metalloprotease [Turicibacter sp.]
MMSKEKNILAIIIYVVGMIILPMLVMMTVGLISGVNPETMTREQQMNLTTTAIVVSYGILTAALLWITKDVFKQDFAKIKSWSNFTLQMAVGLLFTFAAATVGSFALQRLGVTEPAANQAAVEASIGVMPIAMVFSVIVFAPIVEEIVFRLVVMDMLKMKPVFSIVFSSLIFGLMHVMVGGMIHIIPYFLMGLVFGVIYHKNENIWYATVLHALHNGATVLLVFAMQGMMG